MVMFATEGKETDIKNVTVCMVVKNRLSNDARVKKEVRALRDQGAGVTVIAMPEAGFPERESSGSATIIRVPVHTAAKLRMREAILGSRAASAETPREKFLSELRRNPLRRFFADLKRDALWDRRLLAQALAVDADVYHANDLDTLAICAKAASAKKARLIYDSHELWLESSRYLFHTRFHERLMLRRAERRYIHQAEAVIAVTPLRGRKMLEMYPDIRRLEIIENAPEVISELPPRGTLRSLLGADDKSVVVLYQGVLCPERGLLKLLDAAMKIDLPDVRFAVIGMDAWGGTLHRRVRELGLEKRVTILPPVPSEQLPRITVDADIGTILFRNTCLNHYYSLPNKLYEYMMAGVPIISSNFPELAGVVSKTGCGVTVDPESPDSISSAVLRLARDSELRAGMAAAGRNAALSTYNWEPNRIKLVDLYRDVTAE